MKQYLILFFLTCSFSTFGMPQDSLRTENIEGRLFVIHEVEPQETLFALSRRYNVSVEDIKLNNPIVAEGLKVGDILRIPIVRKQFNSNLKTHIVQQGETLFAISRIYGVDVEQIMTSNNLLEGNLSIGQELIIPSPGNVEPAKISRILPDTANYTWHVVRQGETLFGLSKLYNADVQNLTKWNHLSDNSISIGDSLIVGYTSLQTREEPSVLLLSNKGSAGENIEKPSVSTNSQPELNEEPTREIVTNDSNYEEIMETGIAELIENSGKTEKYLALHRTASIGTIIRVKNEMNGREVFVRVLGKLPDTGNNDKVLLKISQSAYERLGAIDKRFRVRISYFPE